MNTLKDSKSVNSPDPDMSAATTTKSDATPQSTCKPKTPLKKDELEKIAKELKMKLSKASVAAKQLLTSSSSSNSHALPPGSPLVLISPPKSSPLKNYYMWKRQIAAGNTPSLTLLPNLYSPDRKLPTLTKPSVLLSSSPLKSIAEGSGSRTRKSSIDTEVGADLNDSPIKRRRADSGAVLRVEPQMVLEEMPATHSPMKNALHPSPVLTSASQNSRHKTEISLQPKAQTTPTMPKKQLSNQTSLLKTPTQSGRDHYNDEEGADLLMYLATSPSPAKPYGNTPRASSAPNGTSLLSSQVMGKPSSLFIAPPLPLTPKRPMFSTAKTPQSRLTPCVYGNLAVPGSALPSAGLALTPAGFNMSDYVNFFTPSPNAAASQGSANANKSFLKTPDFHGLAQPNGPKTPVDGKMINFDKVGLFGLSRTDSTKE